MRRIQQLVIRPHLSVDALLLSSSYNDSGTFVLRTIISGGREGEREGLEGGRKGGREEGRGSEGPERRRVTMQLGHNNFTNDVLLI